MRLPVLHSWTIKEILRVDWMKTPGQTRDLLKRLFHMVGLGTSVAGDREVWKSRWKMNEYTGIEYISHPTHVLMRIWRID